MTGGLQEQVTDGKGFFGFGIKPSSKTVIGSLQVPYIYEDRISQSDFDKVLTKTLSLPSKKYRQMSAAGRRHVSKSYNFEKFENHRLRKVGNNKRANISICLTFLHVCNTEREKKTVDILTQH